MAKQATEKNTPVKKLVHEDLTKINGVLQAITKTIELANKVAETYEALKIGPFTYELYEDLTENGILNVKVAYRTSTGNEIERLMINNPSILNTILGQIDAAINPLNNALQLLKKFSINRIGYYSLLKRSGKASFENGRFILTDENIELMKDEYCRIYIEDDKQEIALDALQKFADAYNNLIEKTKLMNKDISAQFSATALMMYEFVDVKNGKAIIDKPSLNRFLITQ